MINSMRLVNFRSFSSDCDLPFVEIKPLTVFVGKNSSGKSSFLRSFPLLRQSVEAKTSGPILWYGRYVDFGAFKEVKNRSSEEEEIFFEFNLSLPMSPNHFASGISLADSAFGREEKEVFHDVYVKLGVEEIGNKRTKIKSLRVKAYGFEYEFNFINSVSCILSLNKKRLLNLFCFDGGFLPSGFFINSTKDINRTPIGFFDEGVGDPCDTYFHSRFISYLKKVYPDNVGDERLMDIARRINYLSVDSLRDFFVKGDKKSKVKADFERLTKENLEVLSEFSFHKNISSFLYNINSHLVEQFKAVRYLGPLRASGERYYRYQDLQIEEMDHAGNNLVMMLRSFTDEEKNSFSEWTMADFGFGVELDENGLHCELKVVIGSESYNISDMGFGFSQLIPILASIWFEVRRKRYRFNGRNTDIIFVIEQPELHLHPEFQSKVARIFSSVISFQNKSPMKCKIIIETHSKSLIDSIGDCIEENIISPSDVSIVVFDKQKYGDRTNISFSKFDENGFLIDWPVGFFSGRE